MFVDIQNVLFVGEGVDHSFMECCLVRFGVQDDGIGFLSVSSGTSGFLKVGFGRVRQVEMQHDADIRLVDTHTEGIGCHHDADFSALPAFLPEVFDGVIQSGMIEVGGYTFVHQQFSDFFGTASVADIDDGTARYSLQDIQEFFRFVVGFAHDICQILPFKAHSEDISFPEFQTGLNICYDFRSGRSRQCQYRNFRQ